MENERPIPIELRASREALSSWDGFLAFGFGSGLLPRAPGTAGTALAIPLAVLLKSAGGVGFWVLWLALFGLGVWICGRVGRRLGVIDYGGIVWDEMVGYWLAVAFVPANWLWLLAGFVIFRFFDIAKPWPIGRVENWFEGGLGVMLDDVLAALCTAVLLGGAGYVLG